jgi:hypothetical protein
MKVVILVDGQGRLAGAALAHGETLSLLAVVFAPLFIWRNTRLIVDRLEELIENTRPRAERWGKERKDE